MMTIIIIAEPSISTRLLGESYVRWQHRVNIGLIMLCQSVFPMAGCVPYERQRSSECTFWVENKFKIGMLFLFFNITKMSAVILLVALSHISVDPS